VLARFEDAVRHAGLSARVDIIGATCRDRCDFGPNANVYPGPTMYNGLDDDAVGRIVAEHLAGGRPVADFTRLPMPARVGGGKRPKGEFGRDW
jgi:(2Fe-2S) ferredoxin